jgi:mRNA interferase YafQ
MLEVQHRPHKLSGEWAGSWEWHVAPDWLLILRDEVEGLSFLRTGTHSDLFGR